MQDFKILTRTAMIMACDWKEQISTTDNAILFSDQDPFPIHFMWNIQHYQSVFQITSFGADLIEKCEFNPTIYNFLNAMTMAIPCYKIK